MKVLVTGATGYVARTMLPYLLADEEITLIRGIDVRRPDIKRPKFDFIYGDVRNANMEDAMKDVDVVAHLAFIVGEIKDKKKIYDINVNGSKRVLESARSAGVGRLVIASSVSAYGAHPRKGVITEETPLNGNKNSYYSHTKHIVEKMLDEFEKKNPKIIITRLRPSILCGPMTDNFFLELLKQVVIVYPSCNPVGLPLVHEDDVGRAFHIAIKRGVHGLFNIAGGNLSYRKIGEIAGKPTMSLPYFAIKMILNAGYKLGVAPMSSHWSELSRHPFEFSCAKAKEQLGWEPARSPEDAFRELVAASKKSGR